MKYTYTQSSERTAKAMEEGITVKYSKKIFTCLAMIICFSLCIGTVSHAETMISYKETVYGKPINGMGEVYGFVGYGINSSGRLEMNVYDYEMPKLSKADRKKLPKKVINGVPK